MSLCKDCSKNFELPVVSKKYLRANGFGEPMRCKDCAIARAKRDSVMSKRAPSEDLLKANSGDALTAKIKKIEDLYDGKIEDPTIELYGSSRSK